MRVKQLVQLLSECDPEAIVVVRSGQSELNGAFVEADSPFSTKMSYQREEFNNQMSGRPFTKTVLVSRGNHNVIVIPEKS